MQYMYKTKCLFNKWQKQKLQPEHTFYLTVDWEPWTGLCWFIHETHRQSERDSELLTEQPALSSSTIQTPSAGSPRSALTFSQNSGRWGVSFRCFLHTTVGGNSSTYFYCSINMKDHLELYSFPNSTYCKRNRNSRSAGKSEPLHKRLDFTAGAGTQVSVGETSCVRNVQINMFHSVNHIYQKKSRVTGLDPCFPQSELWLKLSSKCRKKDKIAK